MGDIGAQAATTEEIRLAFRRNDHLVGVAGDWHHNADWAVKQLNLLAAEQITTVYQLGDFGFWPGEQGFLDSVQNVLSEREMQLFVTPGNHDNWRLIDAFVVDRGIEPFHPKGCENIWILPRGFRFEQGGRSFLSVGGAPSVDRDERVGEDVDWWPGEVIDRADIASINSGGHADIMLTHDAPHGAAEKVEEIAARRLVEHPLWRDYILEGRYRLDEIYQEVRPTLLLHGHYHLAGVSENKIGKMISFNRDERAYSTAVLDLSTPELRVTFLKNLT